MRSLQASLGLGLLGSLVLAMGTFWWAGSLTARLLAESFVYARLAEDASSVRAALLDREAGRQGPGGLLALSAPPTGGASLGLWPEYDRPASGHWFVVGYDDGAMVESRSSWERTDDAPRLEPGERRHRDLERADGERLLAWSGGFADGGRRYTITVVRSFAPVAALLAVVRWYVAGFAVLLAVALLAVQRYVVAHTVRGLDEIRADIERLEHGRIDALDEDVPAEVAPLVAEFNRLLVRFERRLAQSRNAVGNLAHALKGPLNLLVRAADASGDAGVAGQGDAGPGSPGDVRADVRADVQADVRQHAERIRQIIDGELRRARLAGRTSRGTRFDAAEEIAALAGLLRQVHPERQVEVRVSVGRDVEIPHDRQDMLELVGNLVDNAFKWARSLVMVSLRSADGLLLEIEDDGPGVAPEGIERLTGRGVRLDESVAGHGLGLSIVREIVDTYGGSLELGRSNRLGGFRAAVRLPRGVGAGVGAGGGAGVAAGVSAAAG